jgi:hypothetical protein
MTTRLVTKSGRIVDLHNPEDRDVCVSDVAWGLAFETRWNGCLGSLSVAQHSIAVSELLENVGSPAVVQLYGLLHDAAEAYVGDCVRPMKMAMDGFASNAQAVVEDRMLRAIHFALVGIPPSDAQAKAVADADRSVNRYEAKKFGTTPWRDAIERVAPGYVNDYAFPLKTLETYANYVWTEPPKTAERFLARYERLKQVARAA